jgi:hypothetical protein
MPMSALSTVIFTANEQEAHEAWENAQKADIFCRGRYIGHRDIKAHKAIDEKIHEQSQETPQKGS